METEKKKKDGRGGARPGAGRPATGRKASKAVTIQLGPEEEAVLARVARRSDFIRAAIVAYAECHPELLLPADTRG